jgi:hypothetical protein
MRTTAESYFSLLRVKQKGKTTRHDSTRFPQRHLMISHPHRLLWKTNIRWINAQSFVFFRSDTSSLISLHLRWQLGKCHFYFLLHCCCHVSFNAMRNVKVAPCNLSWRIWIFKLALEGIHSRYRYVATVGVGYVNNSDFS